MQKNFCTFVLAILVVFGALAALMPADCSAKMVYLDNKTGVVNGSTTYDPVTRTVGSGNNLVYTDAYDASKALAAGDTMYIREGEYYSNVTSKPGYFWQWGSLDLTTSNITVKNYNNEVVWIKGGTSRTSVINHTNNAIRFAASNIVVDGLNIYGCVILYGVNGVLQNCDLSGGWDHQSPIGGDAWYDVIRLGGGGNVVRNCNIHDNFDHGTATNSGNKALIMHEGDEYAIVENCKFYNPVAGFVFAKYGRANSPIKVDYRYNWFIGGNTAPFQGMGIYEPQEIRIYQNVFQNCSNQGLFAPVTTTDLKMKIYNNVFYNMNSAVFTWNIGNAHEFYNNIIFANSIVSYGVNYLEYAGPVGSYFNHNCYYGTGAGSIRWSKSATQYSSLSSWQAQGFDLNSVNTNPNFANSSGSFNTPSDFKRSSYPANGRGGIYPAVMGAYITGNEIIGSTNGTLPPSPPPPPPITAYPNPPTNLLVN